MKPTSRISYQLEFEIPSPLKLRVGALGVLTFSPGRYVYTGSARRAIEARIARHLRREKKLHWHIDYLLVLPQTEIVRVRRSTSTECAWHQRTPGQTQHPGFGASDCRSGCISHLKQISELHASGNLVVV